MSVDHKSLMFSRLITQFQGLPNLAAFIKALGDQLNDVEEFYGQLMNDVLLQNAIGVQLDNLGAVLGQGRNSLSDSDYRTVLQARVVQYQAQGTVEDLIQIMQTLAGATSVQVLESFPAGFQLSATGISGAPVSNGDILTAVLGTKLAGVRANILAEPLLPVFQLDLPATANNAGLDVGHLLGPLLA